MELRDLTLIACTGVWAYIWWKYTKLRNLCSDVIQRQVSAQSPAVCTDSVSESAEQPEGNLLLNPFRFSTQEVRDLCSLISASGWSCMETDVTSDRRHRSMRLMQKTEPVCKADSHSILDCVCGMDQENTEEPENPPVGEVAGQDTPHMEEAPDQTESRKPEPWREYIPVLEGLLFTAGEEGISVPALCGVLEECSRQDILQMLSALDEMYDEKHGIELACFGGQYKLVTRSFVFPYARALYENVKVPAYSAAALETLAIIAYKQPVTRIEIEEIRGVACDAVLRKLLMRDLIAADQRSDAVGKPLLYTVTQNFMDAFGLETLDELPDLETPAERKSLFDSAAEPAETK